jgi:RimJ/RimL family protein N-acetyltransferase
MRHLDFRVQTLIPTIETERLRLREWRIADFERYAAFKTDPELQRYILGGAKSREAVWDDFCALSGQWVHRGIGTFSVADRKTDEARGLTGFWYPMGQEVPELCWALFRGNTGKGYATEAALAARRWFFENRSYRRLVSYVHPDNTASCAVAERLGAILHGRVKLYDEDRLLFLHPTQH